MRYLFCFTGLFWILSGESTGKANWNEYKLQGYTQGTTYHILYFAADSLVKQSGIDSLLAAIDSSMSLYKPYSQITQFNHSASEVRLDANFKRVISKSLEVYQASGGISDITVKPLVELWGFYGKNPDHVPKQTEIRSILPCIGSGQLYLKGNVLYKKKPCIQIDVNGIAQGFSVDLVAEYLENHHILNYMVEIGGELRVRGARQPSGQLMSVGIESPPKSEFDAQAYQRIVSFSQGALTTSGSYRKYFENKGKKYAHIIDPFTGYPIQNDLISATVYAKDAMTADAYDNVLLALGLKKALAFTARHPELEAYLLYETKEGKVADTASAGFKKLYRN